MGRPKGGTNRKYTIQEKYNMIKEVIEGSLSTRDAAKKYNVNKTNIFCWVTKFQESGMDGLKNPYKPGNPLAKFQRRKELTEIEKLEYENMKLRIENERLKKRVHIEGGGSSKTKEIIKKEYEIIELLSENYNIQSLCFTMVVSRSGYYKWLKRKGTLNRYQNDRVILSNMIIEVHKKHSTWGYRHIAAYIRKDIGWAFSDNLCHKCCKALKIHSKARKPPYKQGGEEHIVYPNVIHNDWSTTRPLEKVCTDTTIFYNNNKAYDLSLYIDVFNNEIVAYDLSDSKHGCNSSNHLKALKSLLKTIKKEDILT